VACEYEWRGHFENQEVNSLHVDAFGADNSTETDWISLVEGNSLGWVTARNDHQLIGFVNVISDGQTHAWLQDVMVFSGSRHLRIGSQLVAMARDESREAGCKFLHVDFEEHLGGFYFQACGFTQTAAGLMNLQN
jgi:N-acetylglutamate synthase-like GNAT family acetyltransferase